MGRARGANTDSNTFGVIFGVRRGGGRLNLAARHPDKASREYTERLEADTIFGHPQEAIRELQLASASERHSPLLRRLRAAVIEHINHRTVLGARGRESVYRRLQLPDWLHSEANPSASALEAIIGAELDRQLHGGVVVLDELVEVVAAQRRSHLYLGLGRRATASGPELIHLLLATSNGTLNLSDEQVQNEQVQMLLANLPGSHRGSPVEGGAGTLKARLRWASGFLGEHDWCALFRNALDSDDPAAALRDRLESTLFERAHERDENESR